MCDPPIMLLDEPTSALDAVNTRLVVTALKDLTRRGILVIASLHQPRESVFSMFDKLWLMRKGELAYGGRVDEAVGHFSRMGYTLSQGNPADFFIEVCFGMVKGEQDATNVEDIAGVWTLKAVREQSKEWRRRTWALEDPSKSARRGAVRAMLRDALLKELKKRAPDAHRALVTPFPGARIAAVVSAELKRVEWEVDMQTIDKQTWITNYWTPAYGSTMSDRVREELWHRAQDRAQRLQTPRKLLFKIMRWGSSQKRAFARAAHDISRNTSFRRAASIGRPGNSRSSSSNHIDVANARASSVGIQINVLSTDPSNDSPHSNHSSSAVHSSALTSPPPSPPLPPPRPPPPLDPSLSLPSLSEDSHTHGLPCGTSQRTTSGGRAGRARRYIARVASSSNRHSETSRRHSNQSIGSYFGRNDSFVKPTLADLQYEMQHWKLTVRVAPGWGRTFTVCVKRNIKKLIRKRRQLYSKFLSVFLASCISGAVCYSLRDRGNLRPVLYMLCNALCAVVVATSSIDTLGNREERLQLDHEAASGVRPSAEALSRVLLDVAVLAPLGPIFAVPLQALSLMPIGTGALIGLYMQVSWSMATFGYVFSLAAPSNCTLIAAALTLILFAFFSGVLISPSITPSSMHAVFWLNPGYAAFIQIGLGNAVSMPFGMSRWSLLSLFMNSDIMPSDAAGSQLWEFHQTVWYLPSVASLLACGVVLRIVSIGIFAARQMHSDLVARLLKRWCSWPCAGAPRDEDVQVPIVQLSQVLPAGQKTWVLDPAAPPPKGRFDPGLKGFYTVGLPDSFIPEYADGSSKHPQDIKTTLPSGATLVFTPHPRMRAGDLVRFLVPESTLTNKAPTTRSMLNKVEIIFPVESFTSRAAHRTVPIERLRSCGLHASTAPPEPTTVSSTDGHWLCSFCSFKNSALLWYCEQCEADRPGRLEHIRENCVAVRTLADGMGAAGEASSSSSSAQPLAAVEECGESRRSAAASRRSCTAYV